MNYDTLRVYAEGLDDLIRVRVGMENRIKAANRAKIDMASETFGIGLKSVCVAEEIIYKGLVKAFRLAAPDINQWVKGTMGLGEPTVARLLGTLGDPLVARPMRMEGTGSDRKAVPDGEPYERTIGQLWQYCGYGDASLKLYAGMSQGELMAMGRKKAKPILHEIQKNALMSAGKKGYCPYRLVYEDSKERYAETHPEWTLGHIDNAARRIVKKEILRDLWLVCKGLEPLHGGYSEDEIGARRQIALTKIDEERAVLV